MQCKFVNATTGLRCGSTYASLNTGGYCFHHGVATINPKTGKPFISKDKDKIRLERVKQYHEEQNKLRDEGKPSTILGRPKTPRWMKALKEGKKPEGEQDQDTAADHLMHQIIQDKNFNAKEFYREITEGSADAAVRERAAKLTVVKWFLSDEFTRSPQEKYELSKAVGFTKSMMDVFLEGGEFGKMFDNGRKKLMRRMAFFVDKINMKKALMGKREAITEFYDVFKRLKMQDGEEQEEFKFSADEETELEKNEGIDRQQPEPENIKLGKTEREMEAKLIENMGHGKEDWN